MPEKILLLSRDEKLSLTRAQILERAGYRTASASDIRSALIMAADLRPSLAIVGHSFSALEQEAFVERIQEAHSGISILLLRFGLLHPEQLLAECEACFVGQPGRSRVRIVQPAPSPVTQPVVSALSDNASDSHMLLDAEVVPK